MIFSANILKESASNTENVLKSNELNESTFETEILEFNNSIQLICTECDIEYYRLLSEASSGKCKALVLQEGIASSIAGFITNIIQKFIDAIKRFFSFLRGKGGEEKAKEAEKAGMEFEFHSKGANQHSSSSSRTSSSSSNSNNQDTADIFKNKDLTVFHFPQDSEIEDKYFSTSYNNLSPLLDRIFEGQTVDDDSINKALGMGFSLLARAVPRGKNTFTDKVKTSEDFKKLVTADCCYKDTENMSIFDYHKKYGNLANVSEFKRYKNAVSAKVSHLTSMFEKMKKEYESRSLTLTEDTRANAKKVLDAMKQLLDCTLWFSNALVSIYTSFLNYYAKLLNKEIKVESSMIHGEEFNGDTLFDNNDERDFNRTEWLDLSLAMESYVISSILMDSRKTIALKEAEIFADNDINAYSKLIAMREAEEKKTSNRIMDVVKEIGKILTEFITKLQDAVSIDANLIKSNQDIIYNKPFKFDTADSQGDLASGIERIKKDLSIKPFDFNTMKDDLKDDKTFFKKYILPSLSEPSKTKERSGFRYDDNMAVAEYCKAYFGAPSNDLAKCVYSAASMQKMIKDNKDFLEAPHAFIRGIKAVKSDLENQAKRIQGELSKPAPQNNNTANSSTENNANNQKANNESAYYSELYSRWMTLSEINVEGEGPKDTAVVATNGGETSSNGTADLQSGFKVWLDTYRAVLMAKITGAEFIRKEFMAVIKKQIDAYKPKANKNTNTEEKK